MHAKPLGSSRSWPFLAEGLDDKSAGMSRDQVGSLLYGWLFYLCSIFYAFVAVIQESLENSRSVC